MTELPPVARAAAVPQNRARFEHLLPLLGMVSDVPGDFAEMGVWHGHTFVPLARAAARENRLAHAVDSFCGMAAPCECDRDEHGWHRYPAGSMSAGGPAGLERLTADMANVRIHVGFIPDVLLRVDLAHGLAFAHVDLDQYRPTAAALEWVWRRLNVGGLMVCHDYWPGRGCLASRAIDEFIAARSLAPLGYDRESTHVWLRRPPEVLA